MAKRRITLTSQEMNDINGKITLLQSQLGRSNSRVDELEKGLGDIRRLIKKKFRAKDLKPLGDELTTMIDLAMNPPVKVREDLVPDEELAVEA